MDLDDRFNPTEVNDYDLDMQELKAFDKGYNKIYRTSNYRNNKGRLIKKKIEFYTSGGTGSYIRDAESGLHYPSIVGSSDEKDFFKLSLITGECKSRNGSNTLFYLSPSHCASHLHLTICDDIIQKWEEQH